ncbi:membrane protein UL14 [Cercopithecine betaherpesvirus 5]|uniref:Membrane protein UL14 n=1 Tax=Simian cytomegalovirus (strain Colburn) TaxID=50292 RepID=G8XTS1_SCMVC|nr:membrane protein UL14 [Cercopithecine betaherpesvirus 5]
MLAALLLTLLLIPLTVHCIPPSYWERLMDLSQDDGDVSAPLMPPYGDRFDLTCEFPTGGWQEAALQIRFCHHPGCRSLLMVNPRDVTGQFQNKNHEYLPELQWKMETEGPVQRLTVSFVVTSSVSGVYQCTVANGLTMEVLKTMVIISEVELRRRPHVYCDIRFGHRSQMRYLWTPDPEKVRLVNCGEVRGNVKNTWHKHLHYAVGESGLQPSCSMDRDMSLCHRYVFESMRDNNCTRAAEQERALIPRGEPLEKDHWSWMCLSGLPTLCILGILTSCLRLRRRRNRRWRRKREDEEARMLKKSN